MPNDNSTLNLTQDNQSLGSLSDPEKMLAESEFNNACGNAILKGCPVEAFVSVYSQCKTVYGNLTLEQCRSACCDASPMGANFFG